MPGGLLSLVCYGNENLFVNGNPQMSQFHSAFVRKTHFSLEPIQIPLDGPDQLLQDAPILVKAKIPRQGDLLSDLVLRFSLPDIFSKIILDEVQDVSGSKLFTLNRSYEFAWVRQIGVRLIDTVTFTIGGQIIQEFTSDWISARALLDYDNTTYQKWRYLVGDTPEYFDPANGIYAAPGNSYPHAVAMLPSDAIPQPIQNNAPSIPGRIIRVPLGLWFSDYIGNALPLVSLQYHECEIQIKLRPIRDLYTVLDPSGVRLRSNVKSLPYIPSDQYPTTWNPGLLGPLPNSLNNLYAIYSDSGASMRNFLVDFGVSLLPRSDGWPLNLTLEGTYVFVTPEEQRAFVTKTLRYNVRQVQNFIFSGINTRNSYRLDVHNIATRLVYFFRRNDAILYRNQPTNLTNWMYTQGVNRPYPLPIGNDTNGAVIAGQNGAFPRYYYSKDISGNPVLPLVYFGASGLNIAGTRRLIGRNVFLNANGQPLFDSIDTSYFNTYVPYKYLSGGSVPYNDYGLATQGEMWPIYSYSFAINGSSVEQPSGTLNTSRIDRLEMDVDVEPIPFLANYTYELQVFVETLNFLEIASGLGGLKFAK
jgi:hypothetical protein